MTKCKIRVITGLVILLMLLAVPFALAEEKTELQLAFIGMYATGSGDHYAYEAVNLSGSFDVYQNGRHVGRISGDGSAITLPEDANVSLVPVQDTIPAEIPVSSKGYTVSIIPGQMNVAPIVVYANAGLFRVHTESAASFTLITETGDKLMSFSTDSKGDYTLPKAIPAGQYTLRMDSASLAITPWRDKIIDVKAYNGPDSVIYIDAEYYFYPEISLRPASATATPAPQATAEAPVITATPAPQAEPEQTAGLSAAEKAEPAAATATPAPAETPTAAPTATPTATPHPVNGMLVLQPLGSEVSASYKVMAGGIVYGTGELTAGVEVRVDDLPKGKYIVTIYLPDHVMLTGMNGYPSIQRGFAQWEATITAGRQTVYQLDLSKSGSVQGSVLGIDEAFQVNITGSELFTVYGENSFAQTDMNPDVYSVTVILPEGEYAGEGWIFVQDSGRVFAIARADITDGGDVLLPAITRLGSAVSSGGGSAIPEGYVALTVFVFNDQNNNGARGKNEGGVADAIVSLLDGGVAASAKTDADGYATLYVPAGEYTLRCELPENYGYAKGSSKNGLTNNMMDESIDRVQEAHVTLSAETDAEFGVGASRMATLSGHVWLDENGDGLWQAEEGAIPGMRITAEGTKNGLLYEAITDENGDFEIVQIRNGTYRINYYVPDGYVFTFKASGPKEQRSLLTTEAERIGNDQIVFEKGDVVDQQNIGLLPESVVEGYCFLDANYNGYFDEGEQTLAGVELELFRQSNNKRLKTTTSDADGYFRFGHVRGDTFKIKALLPNGYTYSINVPGDADANQFAPRNGRREQSINDVAVENGGRVSIVLGAISYGSISGVAYQDDNFSGDWETGEKITSGLVITLLDESGNAVASVKTNKSGSYTFKDLVPGSYRLSMQAQTGYVFTREGEGNVMTNLGGGAGVSDLFEVALGQNLTGMDAGMIVPAKVTGVAFADANDNGLYDKGETGLMGTVVTLMQAGGEVEAMTVGPDGAFTFDSVMPGCYYLRYELPENGVFSPRVTGGNAVVGEGSNGAGDWFSVTNGDVWTAPVCGGLDLGVISGVVFGDSDGSGAQDGSEQPLAGMTLILTPSRSDLKEMKVVTSADGAFLFDDLRPDVYTLTALCPEGYVLSRMEGVDLGLQHGVSEQSISVTVGMGNAWTEQMLGCVKPASYSGYAWLDENLNGVYDEAEKAASGEKVVLADQNTGDVIGSVVTDENGAFTFEGLAPGSYCLSYALASDVRSASGGTTFSTEDGMLVMNGIQIAENTHTDGAALGLVRETKLAGLVWLYTDDVPAPVADAAVTLYDEADNALHTCATDEAGLYRFEGLMPGAYRIGVELPEGYAALEPGDRRLADGSLVSILESSDAERGMSGVIVVKMAEDQLNLDVGSVLPGRLGDLCWLDLNGNGLQDGGEGGIPGVKIALIRHGEVAAETVSDQYGYYVFEAIYPGEYTLRVEMPKEVAPTRQRSDLPMIVSVLTESGESIIVGVESDKANYNADLGFVLRKENVYPAGYGEGAAQIWD